MKRTPRRQVVGIAVSIPQKKHLDEITRQRGQSVSEFLFDGLVMRVVSDYLGITLSESVARLIQDDADYEEVLRYLSERAGIRTASLPRIPRNQTRLEK